MKEKPILFSGSMVAALLEGRKSQTRRVVKPQPIFEGKECFGDSWKWAKGDDWFSGVTTEQLTGHAGLLHESRRYGAPGDRLWVRESWATKREWNERKPSDLPVIRERKTNEHPCIAYLASGKPDQIEHSRVGRGRPSIHMPRWASRLTLEIVNVRVERVQEITEADAWAEGIEEDKVIERQGRKAMQFKQYEPGVTCTSATAAYSSLWDSLNAKRDGGIYDWKANPWVWCVEFKLLSAGLRP